MTWPCINYRLYSRRILCYLWAGRLISHAWKKTRINWKECYRRSCSPAQPQPLPYLCPNANPDFWCCLFQLIRKLSALCILWTAWLVYTTALKTCTVVLRSKTLSQSQTLPLQCQKTLGLHLSTFSGCLSCIGVNHANNATNLKVHWGAFL